jgi:hypothetical protein
MDGNTPQPQSGKNKLAIIIGSVIVAAILFLPVVLIFVKGSTPKTESSTGTGTGTGTETGAGIGSKLPFSKPPAKAKQAPVPTPYFAYDIYTDEKFSMAYPQTWIIKQTRETEGKTVVFKPPTIGEKEYLPSIMVTIRENKTHPWLTESEDYYRKSLGFQESTITLDGSRATKLFGTFPSKMSPSQSIHIFLTRNNYSYLIKYQYAGKKYNVDSEKLFTSMVANFKFR